MNFPDLLLDATPDISYTACFSFVEKNGKGRDVLVEQHISMTPDLHREYCAIQDQRVLSRKSLAKELLKHGGLLCGANACVKRCAETGFTLLEEDYNDKGSLRERRIFKTNDPMASHRFERHFFKANQNTVFHTVTRDDALLRQCLTETMPGEHSAIAFSFMLFRHEGRRITLERAGNNVLAPPSVLTVLNTNIEAVTETGRALDPAYEVLENIIPAVVRTYALADGPAVRYL